MKSKVPVVKAIKTPAAYIHPDAPYEMLPKHEFSMALIAPKGSGKTTTIVNLLDFYKGYFHTILVFSPTVESGTSSFICMINILFCFSFW